jgi:hypothetical protein
MNATEELTYPRTFGTRLHQEDGEKLLALVRHFRTTPCDVLRLLVRTAEVTNLPPVRFVSGEQEAPYDQHAD